MDETRKGEIAILYLVEEFRISILEGRPKEKASELLGHARRSGLNLRGATLLIERTITEAATKLDIGSDERQRLLESLGQFYKWMKRNIEQQSLGLEGPCEHEPKSQSVIAYELVKCGALVRGITIDMVARRQVGNIAKKLGISFEDALEFAASVANDVVRIVFIKEPKSPFRLQAKTS